MKTDWYRRLTGTTREERKEMVLSATPTLELLKEILELKRADLEEAQKGIALYESPQWAYLQADHLGAIRSLDYVIDLLTLKDRNE